MDLENIRVSLLANKAELEARLARTHKHIFGKEEAVSANFNEQIKQTENDQLVLSLDQEIQEELKQIQRALQRIETGEYFSCANCGEAIGMSRLQAIPDTALCIDCAVDVQAKI